MNRTLIIMRHAKTETQGRNQEDFDRQLTPQGRADAATMAESLAANGFRSEVILCSAAKRTTQTAQIVASKLGIPSEQIQAHQDLYLCFAEIFNKKIQGLNDNVFQYMFVGHNPGISELIEDLCPGAIGQALPTAGLVVLRFKGKSWKEMFTQDIEIAFIDAPKNHL